MNIYIPDLFERLINDNEEYIITIKQTRDEKGTKIEYDFKSIEEDYEYEDEDSEKLSLYKCIFEMEEETKSDAAVKELLLALYDIKEYEAAQYIFSEWQKDHGEESTFNIYALMNLVTYHDYKPSQILNHLFRFLNAEQSVVFWQDVKNRLEKFEETGVIE